MAIYASGVGSKKKVVKVVGESEVIYAEAKDYNMSRDELLKLHEDTCNNTREVMKKKNQDYTAGGGVFANFTSSTSLGVHPVIGILLRSQDKFMRIKSFVDTGKLAVEGEGVCDAIDDVINYMILAKGMILEEQKRKEL